MKLGSTFELGGLGDFEKDEAFSYGCWIRAASSEASGGILARMDEKNDYRGWDLWQQGRAIGVHMIDTWPENGLKVVTRGGVLQPGQWQHVFATYDGSGQPGGVKIFVDGKQEPLNIATDTLKAEASIRTETPLRIGQRSHTQLFDGGAVQDVRIYRRALSPEQVRAIAQTAPLQSILATPAEQRSADQQAALYEHYLTTFDAEFPRLAKAVVDLEAELGAIRSRSPVTHIQEEKKDSPAMAYILARRSTISQPSRSPRRLRRHCIRSRNLPRTTGWVWRSGWWTRPIR